MYGRTPAGLPTASIVAERIAGRRARREGMAPAMADRLAWAGLARSPGVPPTARTSRAGVHRPELLRQPGGGSRSQRSALSTRWMRASEANGIVDHRATERTRGKMASRWPMDLVISQDCAVMTAYYGDLAPDDPAVWREGVAPLGDGRRRRFPRLSAGVRSACGRGGCRRCGRRVQRCPGSMRGGRSRSDTAGSARPHCGPACRTKASRWSCPTTPAVRGAALSRRIYGETIGRISTAFPHWFCQTLVDVRRARISDARGSAPVAGAGRAPRASRRQCDRGPLGRSAWRVPGDAGRRRGLAVARRPRPRCHGRCLPLVKPVRRAACGTTCAPAATTSLVTTGGSTWRR